ncbi:MAG: hypothetical protein QXW32_00540 [Nitrososphaerales archaeon]
MINQLTTNTAYAAKSLNTHLSAVENMVKGLELTTIIENSTSMDKPKLRAQHGLSLLVKVDLDGSNKMTILFDTGLNATCTLLKTFNGRCKPLRTGDTLKI